MANCRIAGRTWTLGFLLVILTAACRGSPVPPTPTPTPTTTPSAGTSAPPVTNPSSAMLAVENPFAIVHRDGSRFGYAVLFLLRETGGKSGATITRIVVYTLEGSDETGPGCWRTELRVPPLGSLDTFYTDEGTNWLSYCEPGSGGTMAAPSLYVIVTFTDDFGVSGSIGFTIASFRTH